MSHLQYLPTPRSNKNMTIFMTRVNCNNFENMKADRSILIWCYEFQFHRFNFFVCSRISLIHQTKVYSKGQQKRTKNHRISGKRSRPPRLQRRHKLNFRGARVKYTVCKFRKQNPLRGKSSYYSVPENLETDSVSELLTRKVQSWEFRKFWCHHAGVTPRHQSLEVVWNVD